MARYTEYTVKSGVKWHVRGYLGTVEATGEQLEFNKRGFKTKKEAQAAYARAKHSFYNGDYEKNKTKNLTFNQVYQEWYEQYKLDVKESSARTCGDFFRLYILPALGKYRIDKISKSMLQNLVNKLHKQMQSYRQVYNYAKTVMVYAYNQEYIKDNVTDRVQVPKKVLKKDTTPVGGATPVRKEGNFYTRTELQEFLSHLEDYKGNQWYIFFRLLAFSGMRKGEAMALTWKDINFKEKTLSIDKTLARGKNNDMIIQTPKTKKSERTISLDEKTIEVLKSWKHEQAEYLIGFGFNALDPKQLVFCKLKSNTPHHLSRPMAILNEVCFKNQLKGITVHGFRHTHASLLFEAGVPMKDVKERLGHSNISTTMDIYTHVTSESKNQSAELFAKYANF